jgi:hypothetical protein
MVPKTAILPARRNPFKLSETGTYRSWRQKKLKNYPTSIEELIVEIKDPRALTDDEKFLVVRACRKTNMVLYSSPTQGDADKQIILSLGRQLGLNQLDHNWLADEEGVTSLTVREDAKHSHYIPYTDKRIRWHTDGYYNPLHRQIGGLLLHCVNSAASGGENALLDHEIAYIKIRDENPEYIRALMRSIEWKDDALTQEAIEFLSDLLNSDSTYVFRGRLEPGMGLLSNNVLHDRTGFNDSADSKRLLYRARYFERIKDTGVHDVPPFRSIEK